MKKERKNEAIWNIFRESGVLMAVCGDMTSQDENELYDEIASAVEAERVRISEKVEKMNGFGKNGKDKVWIGNGKECLFVERKAVISIINPSKE